VAFRLAGHKSGARVKHDNFDESVLEVPREHLTKFLDALYMQSVI